MYFVPLGPRVRLLAFRHKCIAYYTSAKLIDTGADPSACATMLLRSCERWGVLQALTPLISTWGCRAQAAMLHSASDSDTEADTAEVAAFFDELSRDAAALESGGPELQRELDEMLEGIQGHVPVDQQRLLQAGVLGVPNAGKSTLVNGLVGRKVRQRLRTGSRTYLVALGTAQLGSWSGCISPSLLRHRCAASQNLLWTPACRATDRLSFGPALAPAPAQVSAVSPKTNTTEQSRLGAFTVDAAQVVLYDTPGVVGKE